MDREILRLRHRAGALLAAEARGSDYAAPAADLPPRSGGLPEYGPGDLSPERLRASILRDGCMLVRGLVEPDDASALAEEIERAFAARDASEAGASAPAGYYEEFVPESPYPPLLERPWIKEGGGVLAFDSPKVAFDMLEGFARAGLEALVEGYLGERPAMSAQKCTLRKAEPSVPGAWHQDGAFLGSVRSLNLWLALSRCGDEAPGLDIVPRRLDHLAATGTEGTFLSYQISEQVAEQEAGEDGIVRPIFDPGDALLFDELFLHQTGSDPAMPNPRYAIESWFFAPSSFPEDYAPLAL